MAVFIFWCRNESIALKPGVKCYAFWVEAWTDRSWKDYSIAQHNSKPGRTELITERVKIYCSQGCTTQGAIISGNENVREILLDWTSSFCVTV